MRHFMLAALLLSTPCLAGTALPDGPHVVASGDGKVTVAPDMATITLTAKNRNADASVAKRLVDQAVNALLKIAPGFGIGPKDVTAADLSLRESFTEDGDRRTPNGLVASREVTVDLRTLSKLAAFLDAAVAAGVNEVDNVDFASSHKDALRLQARTNAVANAREQAAGLATAFGASLGPVYSINSASSGIVGGYGATTLDRVEVTGSRINVGQYLQPTVDYTEHVSAVFELRR